MNGQPIPGYYWDKEKKKYFKIQSQVAARGLDLKYTVENIRKEERKERFQKSAAVRSEKIRKQRVVRRSACSFANTHVEREIGIKRRSFNVQTLWPDACAFGINPSPKPIIVQRSSHGPVTLFDRDPTSKTVYAVLASNNVARQVVEPNPPFPKSPITNLYNSHWDELTRTTSPASSLCYLPATGALAITTYGSDRPPCVWLTDPQRDDPFVGQQFTPKECNAIWGAAARPTSFSPSPGLANSIAASYTEHLAVAASSSLLLLTRSQAGAWDASTAVKSLNSDILTLDWLSYTTIALGSRDGKIHLHDTRSGGTSHILTHPYPISKLKRADNETRLLCSGLQDSLFLYDIRSPKLSRPSSSKPTTKAPFQNHHYNEEYFKTLYPGNRDSSKRRKLTHKSYRLWSQPLLSFPHANRDELELDVDVHPRLGLVAAAQDLSTGTAVRVSNLWTGRTVKEIRLPAGKKGGKIRTVRFVEGDDERGGVEVWTTWEGGIVRFGWEEEGDEELLGGLRL